MSDVLQTKKSFGQFLKFVSVDGLLDEAVLSFNTTPIDIEDEEGDKFGVYCKIQNKEANLRGSISLQYPNEIEREIGIFKLGLLRDIYSAIGPELEISFAKGDIELKSDKSTYRYLLCDPEMISDVNPKKARLKKMFFSSTFKIKEETAKILKGMSLIDSDLFLITAEKETGKISIVVGNINENNFIYELQGEVNEDVGIYLNKEHFSTILNMFKGYEITIDLKKDTFAKISMVDEDSKINCEYISMRRLIDEKKGSEDEQ